MSQVISYWHLHLYVVACTEQLSFLIDWRVENNEILTGETILYAQLTVEASIPVGDDYLFSRPLTERVYG